MRWSPTSTKGRGCDCDRKVRHASRAAAITEMRRLVSIGTAWNRLDVYRCKFCECWHIGHRGRRAVQR